jgi:hypothetical protein
MLETVAILAQVVSAIAVAAAVVFALVQVRQYRQQRRDIAGVELMRAMHNPKLIEAVARLASVRPGVSADELREMGSEFEEAAVALVAAFESAGVLVFRGTVPFLLVRDLFGGSVVSMWLTLRIWVEDTRAEQSQETFGEWFQWLAERLQAYESAHHLGPAHKRFADWEPRD